MACCTGYPPAETVAPEKQARANQLEVDKSSKCHYYISSRSIFDCLLGRRAHQNSLYFSHLQNLRQQHLHGSIFSCRWRFASASPPSCSALPSSTSATSSSTSTPRLWLRHLLHLPQGSVLPPAILMSGNILNIRHIEAFLLPPSEYVCVQWDTYF